MSETEALLDLKICLSCVNRKGKMPIVKCPSGCLPYPLRYSDRYDHLYIWLLRYSLINSCKNDKNCWCKICIWKVSVYKNNMRQKIINSLSVLER